MRAGPSPARGLWEEPMNRLLSGVSAGVLTLALYRLGVANSALYDGSWAEWGEQGGPPVATGPA